MEAESRCEKLLIANERTAFELKTQKESHFKEIESIRQTEILIKKILDALTGQYSQLSTDSLELRVVCVNKVQL